MAKRANSDECHNPGRYQPLDPDAIDWNACERRWAGGRTRLRWATSDEIPDEQRILGLHTHPEKWKDAPPMVAVITSQGELSQCLPWDTAAQKFLVTRDMMPQRHSLDTVEVEIYPCRPQVFEVKEPMFFEEDEGIDDVCFEPGSILENHGGQYNHVSPERAANGRYLSEAQAYQCIDRYNLMNGLIKYAGSLRKDGMEYGYIANPEIEVKFEDIQLMEKHICKGRKVRAQWLEDGRFAVLTNNGETENILSARIAQQYYDLGAMPRRRLPNQVVEIKEKPFIAYAVKVVRPTVVTIQNQKHYLEVGDYIEYKKRKGYCGEIAAVRAQDAAERFASYDNAVDNAPNRPVAGRSP